MSVWLKSFPLNSSASPVDFDAAARHHCYELHIGFTHLGWNVCTGNQADLAATARRLAEILERGPLPLASVRPSAET